MSAERMFLFDPVHGPVREKGMTRADFIASVEHLNIVADEVKRQLGLPEPESDPVFTAWDKSTGIRIASSQITDLPTPANMAGQVFTFASPGMTWTVTHNLGYRPTVEVYRVDNVRMYPSMTQDSNNSLTIYFNALTSGYVLVK
jgi:hypothetical protein